jgi:uncharacterized protein (DUF427 family)
MYYAGIRPVTGEPALTDCTHALSSGEAMTPRDRIEPGPGQESVWDYPRPPRVEPASKDLRVEFAGEVIAETSRGLRVLETSHPPAYYFPREDVRMDLLEPAVGTTFCEFKGEASYFAVVVGKRIARKAAWTYESPSPGYEELAGRICFYASRVDACYVGDEQVTPQEGDFYGGWITSDVVGPFKGGLGTMGW